MELNMFLDFEGYNLESPNLNRSSHAQFFGILKKLTFLQEELFFHFFTILCLQSLLSVYLIIHTNIQIST